MSGAVSLSRLNPAVAGFSFQTAKSGTPDLARERSARRASAGRVRGINNGGVWGFPLTALAGSRLRVVLSRRRERGSIAP